jgi:putative ABC transport system ATP-binding protein
VSTIGVNGNATLRPREIDGTLEDVACSSFIRIENLTKVFSSNDVETRALSKIQLSIRRGEYVALSGPSGCGKSTLLSIMGLLDTPTSGSYQLDGRDTSNLSYTELSAIRNQEIGFVFQSFNLIEEMTVYENVALPLSYRRGMSTTELKQRVFDSLTRVGMDHRAKHYPAQLSGGQQQRIAVARALAGSPSLLLADEPTGNLDSENGDAVMGLLDGLHKDGTTICIVTHDPRFAACAERQIHLFDGKIRIEG